MNTSSTSTGETYYRCIAGSFKDKANAEKRKAELEVKGFTGVFLEAFKKIIKSKVKSISKGIKSIS